jgi:outer membrane protein OmpA-like peptidoglycan-associated protein
MVTGPGVDTGLLSNLGSVNADSLISTGSTLLANLFGNKTAAVDDAIASSSGLRTSEVSRLMAMAIPLVLAFLKKLATTDRLDAGKFASLLVGQKDFLAKSGLDNRIVNALGFPDLRGLVGSLGDSAAGAARGAGTAVASAGAATAVAARSGIRRWLPWIIAAVVAALLLAMWLGRDTGQVRTPAVAPSTTAPAITAPSTPPAATLVVPDQIYFDTGSAVINADSALTITRVAMQIASGANVALTGYTDSTGDSAANEQLAKDRAIAVRDALIAEGAPAANITLDPPLFVTAGVGDDRAARRVEITRK